MITSIVQQPTSNSISAAYRPIVYLVNAQRTDGTAIPPVVFCDVYINGTYYRTYTKTRYEVLNVTDSSWLFDIQDSLQEYLTKYLADNGETRVTSTNNLIAQVFCRFRSSGYNSEGFITPEDTAPVQATNEDPAVSGTGTESNTHYVVNATLQHEQNQDLVSHLEAYKRFPNGSTWDTTTWPLTHRPDKYLVCIAGSDQFPIITDKVPTGVKLFYRNQNASTYTNASATLPCTPVTVRGQSPFLITPVFPTFPDAYVGTPYTYSFDLDGTQPLVLSSIVKPSWMTISIVNGSTLSITGTPDASGEPVISFRISNTCSHLDFSQGLEVNPTAPCIAVDGPQPVFPAATIGVLYSYSFTLTGTAPFILSAVTKPVWVGIGITGNVVSFSGTPDASNVGAAFQVSFVIRNCSNNTKSFSGSVLVGGNGRVHSTINPKGYVRIVQVRVNAVIVGPKVSGTNYPIEPGQENLSKCIVATGATVDVDCDFFDANYSAVSISDSTGFNTSIAYTGPGTYHFTGVDIDAITQIEILLD